MKPQILMKITLNSAFINVISISRFYSIFFESCQMKEQNIRKSTFQFIRGSKYAEVVISASRYVG